MVAVSARACKMGPHLKRKPGGAVPLLSTKFVFVLMCSLVACGLTVTEARIPIEPLTEGAEDYAIWHAEAASKSKFIGIDFAMCFDFMKRARTRVYFFAPLTKKICCFRFGAKGSTNFCI